MNGSPLEYRREFAHPSIHAWASSRAHPSPYAYSNIYLLAEAHLTVDHVWTTARLTLSVPSPFRHVPHTKRDSLGLTKIFVLVTVYSLRLCAPTCMRFRATNVLILIQYSYRLFAYVNINSILGNLSC